MSSTTMHMSPGLPIMKSPDLVKWKLIGYAYDTLADNDELTLQNGMQPVPSFEMRSRSCQLFSSWWC